MRKFGHYYEIKYTDSSNSEKKSTGICFKSERLAKIFIEKFIIGEKKNQYYCDKVDTSIIFSSIDHLIADIKVNNPSKPIKFYELFYYTSSEGDFNSSGIGFTDKSSAEDYILKFVNKKERNNYFYKESVRPVIYDNIEKAVNTISQKKLSSKANSSTKAPLISNIEMV